MSGLCRVRIPGYGDGERCCLHRGKSHPGDYHVTRSGKKFPIRVNGERATYGF